MQDLHILTDTDENHVEVDKTSVKSEIGLNFSEKIIFLKKGLPKKMLILICGIIGLIAFITMVVTITMNNSTITTDLSNKLVLTCDERKICSFDLKNQRYNILHESENKIKIFNLHPSKGLLWIDEEMKMVRSSADDNLNITFSSKIAPEAIAVDFVTDKLYIIDELAGTLNVIDMRNDYYGIALTDLRSPHDVLLDTEEGLMFILQLHHSILRAYMDGKYLKTVIIGDKISIMTIDYINKRIYWFDSEQHQAIECSNYDGGDRFSITLTFSDIVSINVLDDKLFWLSNNQLNNSVIHSCTIKKSNCQNHAETELSFKSKIIKTFPRQPTRFRKNLCSVENGDCEHLCLLSSYNLRSCNCKLGWKMNEDLKVCEQVKIFLFYAHGDFFKGRVLDHTSETFVDVIEPIHFTIEPLTHKYAINFDINDDHDKVYFSDDYNIYKLNTQSGKQSKIFAVEDGYYIDMLSINSTSETLYYLKKPIYSGNYSLQKVIFYRNFERFFEKTVTPYRINDDPPGPRVLFDDSINPTKIRFWISNYGNRYVSRSIYDDVVSVEISTLDYILPKEDLPRSKAMSQYKNWTFISNLTDIFFSNSTRFNLRGGNFSKFAPKLENDSSKNISGIRILKMDTNIVTLTEDES